MVSYYLDYVSTLAENYFRDLMDFDCLDNSTRVIFLGGFLKSFVYTGHLFEEQIRLIFYNIIGDYDLIDEAHKGLPE